MELVSRPATGSPEGLVLDTSCAPVFAGQIIAAFSFVVKVDSPDRRAADRVGVRAPGGVHLEVAARVTLASYTRALAAR
jgi:hypothetical protein